MKPACKQYHNLVRRKLRSSNVARSLNFLRLGVLLVLLSSSVFYTRAGIYNTRAYAATSSTLNFQARLAASSGTVVADGNYTIEFKLYTVSSGGASVWTEKYQGGAFACPQGSATGNANTQVRVVNGYLTVNLGHICSFPSSIDWSQEHWLTMNVNGDGEMNPRLKLTAVPYAFRAGQSDSLTNGSGTLAAGDLIQKTPATIQDFNALVAAIRLNQTGTGGLLQLQGDGADVFTVSKTGTVLAKGSIDVDGAEIDIGTLTQAGALVLHDASGNTGTLKTALAGLSANRVYYLPDEDGTVCLQNSANCGFLLSGGANAPFVNNGNSFGGLATLGTNDDNALAFETFGTTKMTIQSNGNVGIGTTGIPAALLSIGGTTGNLSIDSSGNVTTTGLFNTNTFTATNLTFGGVTGTISTTANGNLTLSPHGTGVLSLNTGSTGLLTTNASTIRRAAAGLTIFDLLDSSDTTLALTNSGAGALSLTVDGGATFGNGLTVNAGGATIAGNSTITGALSGLTGISSSGVVTFSGLGTGLVQTGSGGVLSSGVVDRNNATFFNTALTVANGGTGATTFTANGLLYGNGTGAIASTGAGNSGQCLVAATGLAPTWGSCAGAGSGATLQAVYDNSANPEIVLNTSGITVRDNTVAISGNLLEVQSNNGATTYFGVTAGGTAITGTLVSSGALTVSGGGAAITGNSSVAGTFQVSSTLTVTAGGLVVNGGINNNGGGITNAGSVAGITTLSLSGAITGATATNTINGLIINAGALSGVTGITFTSGDLNLNNGGITNAGPIAGATNITATGLITGVGLTAGTGLVQGTGGLTLTGPLSLNNNAGTNTTSIGTGTTSGQITIGGGSASLVINSTAFDVSSAGALSGITTIGLSGAITGATATNTINGLVINSGSLSAVTGFAQSSGNFAITGTGTFSTGTGAISLNGATSVTGTNAFSVGTGMATFGGRITANAGLTLTTGQTITINGNDYTDINGLGLEYVSGVLRVDVTTSGAVAGTSSNSGLISAADGLSLLRGCSNGQILKWNGSAWACAADNSGISDARYKENVQSVGSLLDRIKDVNVVTYNFKCNDPAFEEMRFDCDTHTGVIAQELEKIFPELVMTMPDGHKEVNFGALNFYTLQAVTELAHKVDAQSSMAAQNEVRTGNTLRIDSEGVLQNITGLNMISGGASVRGGINNNSGGITNAGLLSGVTGMIAQNITLNANATDNMLALHKDGTGVFTVFNNGALELKLNADSALAVKNKDGNDHFSINTNGGLVQIGSASPDGQAVLLVLDSIDMEGDPAGVNGAQYYSAARDKFRCYQNNQWQDCLPVASTSEYVLDSGSRNWNQPAAEQEYPGEPRTWVDFAQAREFRITARLTKPGAAGSNCRLQYALNDEGPWTDMDTQVKSALSLQTPGSLKSEWAAIDANARKEVLVRIMCKQGNYDSLTLAGAVPQFSGIKLQVR